MGETQTFAILSKGIFQLIAKDLTQSEIPVDILVRDFDESSLKQHKKNNIYPANRKLYN